MRVSWKTPTWDRRLVVETAGVGSILHRIDRAARHLFRLVVVELVVLHPRAQARTDRVQHARRRLRQVGLIAIRRDGSGAPEREHGGDRAKRRASMSESSRGWPRD
jgi:hypothetical protein